ncbi:MAG: alpha/beta hydrolase [Luteolibacter sp.]
MALATFALHAAEETKMWTPAEIGSGAFSQTPDKSLAYKTVTRDGKPVELRIDTFLPPGHQASDKRPAIVFFHGGGWYGGHNNQFFTQCRYLALRGMVAFAAEYRCINDFKTTPKECVIDGKSAVRWLRQHATELGIDPDKLAAGGDSAGGHIAAATAFIKGFEEESEDKATNSRPDALVLFEPVLDNGPGGFANELVKAYWKDFSPIDNIGDNPPPAIVLLGTNDEYVPVETGKRFQRLMQEKGGRSDLHLYQDKKHGFFNLWIGKEYLAITLVEVDRFLASLGYLKGEPILDLKKVKVDEFLQSE